MLWLYLDFYALQLDALAVEPLSEGDQVSEPRSPLILVEAQGHSVVQHNREAAELGIQVGMGMAMAISLAQHVSVLEYKAEFETQKLKQIAQLLYQFSADIALDSPQGLFLRIDSMLTLYHGLDTYWQSLQQPLAELGFRYRYATGTSPLMAKLLARAGRNAIETEPGRMKRALQQLQLGQLALPEKEAQKLQRVGISQLGQVLSLPMKELARRFDIHLLNYIGRITGELKHGLPMFRPSERFSAELELMFEATHTQVLARPLLKLLTQMEQYLQLHALVTQSIHFALMYRYDEYLEVTVARTSGEYKAKKWLQLLELKLESVKLEEPVVSLRLWADKLRPQSATSGDLFEIRGSGLEEEELIALLQAKVGSDKVLSMHCRSVHHPELTTQLCAVGSEEEAIAAKARVSTSKSAGSRTGEGAEAREDKLRKDKLDQVLAETEPETRWHHRPSLQLASPILLRQAVTICRGPERLQTSWWEPNRIQRDYFIARMSNGKWCWVFRTPQKQWFLQGYFA